MTGVVPDGRVGDGVLLTNAHTETMRAQMLRLVKRLPAVLHGTNELGVPIPTSETNEDQIGRMAAEHFFERGHKNFAILAHGHGECISRRIQGFTEFLSTYGYEPIPLLYPETEDIGDIVDWIAAELTTLPRPLALFALDDLLAAEAIEAAWQTNWRIPDDLAVLGVSNNPLACEYSRVPISSVAMPTEDQAYQAARMLDQLMRGETLPSTKSILPPVEVIVRKSSDTLAVTHPNVKAAMDYIQSRALKGSFSLADAAKVAGVSLSKLYTLFHEEMRTTPADLLQMIRLQQAQHLLRLRKTKIEDISAQCGFGSQRTFQRAFKKIYGLYPTQWRDTRQQDNSLL